jgi:hypothetical protein
MTTEEYKDRIDDINVAYANVVEDMKSFMTRLYGVADSAGIENPTLMSPDELLTELNKRVIMLNRKDLAEIRDALRTIGYNDTEIEQCLADVPDLTMADIDYARTFAEGWKVGKKTYGTPDINDLKLRIMPKVDYSEATSVAFLFQKATNLEYIPTLDWPKVTKAPYVFWKTAKLKRFPQVNAPEAVNIAALYCIFLEQKAIRLLPPVISHPKATIVDNLFAHLPAAVFDTLQTLDLDFNKITTSQVMFQLSSVEEFLITEFTADKVAINGLYASCMNIRGDQSHVKWNVPHATTINLMFHATRATALDLSGIKTSECTDFDFPLTEAPNLKYLDLSTWDVSSAELARSMIEGSGFEELDFSHKHFPAGCNVENIFGRAKSLHKLILTDVDFSQVAQSSMRDAYFYDNPALETIIGPVTGFHSNVDLGAASRLTAESAMVIINGLAEVNSSSAATLTLHASAYNRLTPEQIAVATSKGWRVVKNA